jgi:hypothetical protein
VRISAQPIAADSQYTTAVASGQPERGLPVGTEHEQRVQRHLEQRSEQVDRHHGPRPGHGHAERAECAEPERGRQSEGERVQVGGGPRSHRWVDVGQRQQRSGVGERDRSGHQQPEGEPAPLAPGLADLGHPSGAVVLRRHRRDRLQRAHQADEHDLVDARADRDRRQFG